VVSPLRSTSPVATVVLSMVAHHPSLSRTRKSLCVRDFVLRIRPVTVNVSVSVCVVTLGRIRSFVDRVGPLSPVSSSMLMATGKLQRCIQAVGHGASLTCPMSLAVMSPDTVVVSPSSVTSGRYPSLHRCANIIPSLSRDTVSLA